MFVFYDTLNAFTSIWRLVYGKGPSDSERGNETHCHHMGYSFRLAAKVFFYKKTLTQHNTLVTNYFI